MEHPPGENSSAPDVSLELDRADGPPDLDLEGIEPAGLIADEDDADFAGSLEELATRLEGGDGEDLAFAVEGLALVEPEIRTRIIEGLGALPRGPGLSAFLRALAESDDPETCRAAREVLGDDPDPAPIAITTVADRLPALVPAEARGLASHRLTRSLVTAVDREGRATIAIASLRDGEHRSAVFRCDVLNGIRQAVGRVELDRDDPASSSLIDEIAEALPAEADRLQDVPELALCLLAGILFLNPERAAARSALSWVDEVLGPGFRPRPIPVPAFGAAREEAGELSGGMDIARQSRDVLDRCTSWFDTSALTIELAEEIELREGAGRPTDPARQAGAYRYLFEHRLIHRLDLYGRMLLWMAWFWKFTGESELADSSLAVAAELADEQYAVPSHPFTVALTTRSLDEARMQARARRG